MIPVSLRLLGLDFKIDLACLNSLTSTFFKAVSWKPEKSNASLNIPHPITKTKSVLESLKFQMSILDDLNTDKPQLDDILIDCRIHSLMGFLRSLGLIVKVLTTLINKNPSFFLTHPLNVQVPRAVIGKARQSHNMTLLALFAYTVQCIDRHMKIVQLQGFVNMSTEYILNKCLK